MMTMKKNRYKRSDITSKIIGCAYQVHNSLGTGFQEVIDQRSMKIEIEKQGLNFIRELEIPIYYDDSEVGTRRVDFLVEDKIMVELKAISQLEKVHLAQGLNYLEAYHLEIGLLINFGSTKLEFKRLINEKKYHDR